ncbi:MAG: integrase core domain-containing protein [Burkholderia sp.]
MHDYRPSRANQAIFYHPLEIQQRLKFWGITPSYAFVAEPQTNGVAKRFNRTMQEQAIHGRLFKNVEEVRAAGVAFKDRYNREWRLEKLGFKFPLEARQAALLPPDHNIVSKQPDPVQPTPPSLRSA